MDDQCADCGAHFNVDAAGDMQGAACPECGGTRLFMNQVSPTQSDGTLRNMVDSDSQKDMGGNPLGEGTIMGTDGERPMGKRDNYMHSNVAESATKKVEMRSATLNIEPYESWQFGKSAADINGAPGNPIRENPGVQYQQQHPNQFPDSNISPWEFAGLAGTALLPGAAEAGAGALGLGAGGEAAAEGAAGGTALDAAKQVGQKILPKALGEGASTLMKNVFNGDSGGGGGLTPTTPGANLMQFGSVNDIPFLLTADLETPHSVKSVDEQHDDPEKQDQKEFNDGDKSPSNMKNPNLEDSGKNGEDDTRSDSAAQTGFAENSPGIERMQMLMPLIMHYLTNPGGDQDPLMKGLHEALDAEQPGYLDNEHPNGPKVVEMIVGQHKTPPKQADVNGYMPGGLPATPTPNSNVMQQPQPGTPPAQSAAGVCPQCGSPLTADGSCPQCGFKQHPQGGQNAQQQALNGSPANGGVSAPGVTQPFVGKVANGVGPATPEQKAAVEQLLINQGREAEIPYVETEPQRFWKELTEIQGQQNATVPLVDPTQQQQSPPGMPPGGAPGAMPVTDPSQMGGGGGMPMQPMSHTADANNAVRRCPHCGSATTTAEGVGDNTGDGTNAFGHCHSCNRNFDLGQVNSEGSGDKASSFHGLVAFENPELQNAADRTMVRPEQGQDPSQTWIDSDGAPIEIGQTYDLHTKNYPVPDEVQVVTKKPDELGLKLVGEVGNDPNDNSPDFKVNVHELKTQGYTFTPAVDAQASQADQPIGGMPGMEQIPQSPPTTDEQASSYPNGGASLSHVTAALMDNDDNCPGCGNDRIYHTASSETTTLHECDRCSKVWETNDDFQGIQPTANLDWIMNDSSLTDDSFFAEMERAQKMYGGGSRNLASIASQDERYQQIKERLDANKMQREAGRHFTPSEQRTLINERGTARNSDMLDLSNTHYEEASVKSMYGRDPRDPFNRNNGDNAPDSHVFLGL